MELIGPEYHLWDFKGLEQFTGEYAKLKTLASFCLNQFNSTGSTSLLEKQKTEQLSIRILIWMSTTLEIGRSVEAFGPALI